MFKRKIILLAAFSSMFFYISCSVFNNPTKIRNYVKVETSEGDFVIGLYEGTPLHRDNFMSNAKSGLYDSTLIYSVVPNGMIKMGLPVNRTEKEFLLTNLSESTLSPEINSKLIHKTGAVGMLRLNNDENKKFLSDKYLFYLIEGISLEKKMLNTLEAKRNAPLIADYIRRFLNDPQNSYLEDSLTYYRANSDNDNFQRLYLQLTDSIKPKIEADGEKLFVIDEAQRELYSEFGGAPIYDGQFSVFGEIVMGLDVLNRFTDVRIGLYNKPKSNIYIIASTVLSKKEYKNYKKELKN